MKQIHKCKNSELQELINHQNYWIMMWNESDKFSFEQLSTLVEIITKLPSSIKINTPPFESCFNALNI